jgi:hypothetical protein
MTKYGTDAAVVTSKRMPDYRLTIVNEHYSDSADLKANDMIHAWQEALASAIHVAADQVSHGAPFFGAEVRLEEGEKLAGRYIVSVGATPLKD